MANNQNNSITTTADETDELYKFLINIVELSPKATEECIARCKKLGFGIEQMSFIYRTNVCYRVMEYFWDIVKYIPGKTPKEIYENDFDRSGRYLPDTEISGLGWDKKFIRKNNMLHSITGGTVLMHPWWWED